MAYGNPYYNKYATGALGAALLGLQASGPNGGKTGGYNTGMVRSGRARAGKRRRVGSLSSMVKKVVNRMAETKHNTQSFSTAVTHNNIYSQNINAQIVQGNAEGQREADSVSFLYLKVRMSISTAAASGAFSYRVIVCYNHQETNPPFNTTGLSFADMFFPCNAGQIQYAVTNPKACSVLYDAYVDINSLIATTSDVATHCFTVSLNDVKFPYVASASLYGKYKNLYFVVIPYVVGGTNNVTACGTVGVNYDVAFKDE